MSGQTTRTPITVTFITLNEEQSLPRALASVRWADEIVVVDSGSTDQTVEIAQKAGAKVYTNPWPGYGKQKNFAQDKASHDWVLNLDADEEVPPELAQEIQEAVAKRPESRTGFAVARKTYYLGRWIRHGGWYPNTVTRMANRNVARWTEPHVHERLEVPGHVHAFKHPLNHYTFSSIEDQILTNLRYSRFGFFDLQKRGQRPSLGKLLLKPIGKFFETYLIKRGFLDGLPGLIISINAAHSMFLKYAYLFERGWRESPDHR